MNTTDFNKLLESTGMLHFRMPADPENSLEYRLLHKPVTARQALWDADVMKPFHYSGNGSACTDHAEACLKLEASSRAESWPDGSPDDGDYCTFGSLDLTFDMGGENWQEYNRISFQIRPDCKGMHSPMIALQLYNDGFEKIPDIYCREGYHTIHLKNREWNECVWEFPSLPRDRITALTFQVHSYGKELSMADTMCYQLKEIYLEHTQAPDVTQGWSCMENIAVYSTEGYFSSGMKTAVTGMPCSTFYVCNAEDGASVYTGQAQYIENEKGNFYIWDFSDLTEDGTYILKADSYCSKPFTISSHPLYQSVWKVLNFLYSERCGCPIGRGHGTCHGDILAQHNGLTLSYSGGWHDAGDVSQQTLQTAEVVHALLEMAKRVQNESTALYLRLMEEAVWGLDFVLRMRFGDGYRATSAGIRRFSDGLMGNMDDCSARVHNHAFENYLMAGVEAYAATCLKEMDPELSEKAYASACEDYRFAEARFTEKGMELPIFFEHTYNSGLSQYYATASWAASLIYQFEQESVFGQYAADYGDKMMACQETGSPTCPMKGFFYREPDRKTIVHFNHQSREQIFVQALEALCLSQPGHPLRSRWEHSMNLYGEYLKQIHTYSAPYGMLPAGIHKMDEYLDRDVFPLLHLMTTYEEDSVNYLEQLRGGIALNDEYCLKQFPVWFSFRGNTAVHLSQGKTASILGRYFQDSKLTEIARDQLYWLYGRNPFGQSLIYGAGSNYAQQYGALNGEMTGSIPVGIETRGNSDIPFWPMENNATYKEVWTTSAGRWLWVAADLY